MTCSGGASHGFRHLLITSQCLYAEADGLKLSAHLIELVDVTTSSNKVFGHHFASVLGMKLDSGCTVKKQVADQLTGFCTLLNVHYKLFLALF